MPLNLPSFPYLLMISSAEQLLHLRGRGPGIICIAICQPKPGGEKCGMAEVVWTVVAQGSTQLFQSPLTSPLPPMAQELHLGRNSAGMDGARQLAAGISARCGLWANY